MDLQTVKYGLSIAACGILGIIVFFALYIRMGQSARERAGKKN